MRGDAAEQIEVAGDAGDGGGRLEEPARPPAGRRRFGLEDTGSRQGAGRRPETDDGGDVLEAGAPGPFLFAADQQGIDAPPPRSARRIWR